MKSDPRMTDRPAIHGVIVTHATLAEALRQAVARVAGDANDITTVSNEGLSAVQLGERILAAVRELDGAPCIVMVDLQGGSCAVACMAQLHDLPNVRVVSGVNLPMLADFVLRRGDHDIDALVQRMLERGRRSVQELKGGS
jgi:mannose/fructose-specific phosphotransferase system component IIA